MNHNNSTSLSNVSNKNDILIIIFLSTSPLSCCILLCCCFLTCRYFIENKRKNKKIVKLYPISSIKIDDSLECSICLDDFTVDTKYCILECTHIFHHNCINKWLETGESSYCPNCRQVI
jgi:hypothetical protein